MSDEPVKKEKVWTRYVHNRINQNKNFNCVFTGQTGSGKSYSVLSWCEELDPSFNASRVVFTPKEFMTLLSSPDLKAGQAVLFDEIGVAMNSKEHMSVISRALNFVFQTYRHRNLIVFMTTPHLKFLDASVRRLIHAHGVTVGINFKQKTSRLQLFSIQVSQSDGQIYRKYLRVKKHGLLVPVTEVRFKYPSVELVAAYEAKKTDFTTNLNRRMLGLIERADEKELGKQKNIVLTEPQQKVLEGVRLGKQLKEIAVELSISPRAVSNHKTALEKKGYAFKPRKEGLRVVGYDIIAPQGRVV